MDGQNVCRDNGMASFVVRQFSSSRIERQLVAQILRFESRKSCGNRHSSCLTFKSQIFPISNRLKPRLPITIEANAQVGQLDPQSLAVQSVGVVIGKPVVHRGQVTWSFGQQLNSSLRRPFYVY
jgi:hypothetical protein